MHFCGNSNAQKKYRVGELDLSVMGCWKFVGKAQLIQDPKHAIFCTVAVGGTLEKIVLSSCWDM